MFSKCMPSCGYSIITVSSCGFSTITTTGVGYKRQPNSRTSMRCGGMWRTIQIPVVILPVLVKSTRLLLTRHAQRAGFLAIVKWHIHVPISINPAQIPAGPAQIPAGPAQIPAGPHKSRRGYIIYKSLSTKLRDILQLIVSNSVHMVRLEWAGIPTSI